MSSLRVGLALSWLFLALATAPVFASPQDENAATAPADKKQPAADQQDKPRKFEFMRLTRDEKKQPVSMDTAIVTYIGRNAQGEKVRVDLIGAVHIGDRSYYQQLNKEFEKYDSLLYELVAPKGAQPQRGAAGAWQPIGNLLDLDDQIKWIDYEKDNFVHADMSWDEFSESMKKRQESFLKMYFRMIGYSLAKQTSAKSGSTDADFLMAILFAKNRALALKRVMASQFDSLGDVLGGLSGPEGSTIITERNKVALAVLAEQIKAGKKRLGIFYGAGHLTDMDKRLLDEFKFRRGKTRWLVAWDLRDKPSSKKRDHK